jgi:Zn-dependent protease/CBS domain-containing protein
MTDQRPPAPRAMPGRGVRLLSVNKVPIYVSPISLIFMVYMGVQFNVVAHNRIFDVTDNQAYGLAAGLAVMTMVSIVLHELGHSLVAQLFRFDVHAITIYGFVGLTEFQPEPQTPFRSFAVSVAGPLVNLVIGVPALFWYGTTDPHTIVGVLALGIAFVNIGLGVFNLLPGLPLDGGSAFAAGVWKLTGNREQSVRVAAYSGFVVAAAFGVYGLQSARTYYLFLAAIIGLGAASVLKRSKVVEKLPSINAKSIMRPAVTVEANLPLSEALRRAATLGVTAVIVNDSSGRPWALMNGGAVDAVPPERRPWTTINQVSRPIEDGLRIPEDMTGQELMDRLQTTPASEYLVYGPDDRPVGVLVMVDVVARLDPAAAQRLAPRR